MEIVISIEPNRKPFDAFSNPINFERARNKSGCVTPLDSPYSLFKDDTKTLASKQYILGQVLNGLLLTLSSYLFKYNKRVYMLPETFCSYVNKDISLEKTIPRNCEDIDFIVALSYFNSHWSLVMIDCTQRYIYYLDPLNNYVPKHKVEVDIEVVTRIICFHVLRKPYSEENILSVIPDWTIVTSKNFRCIFHQKLPKQSNGWDCGMFCVMYFYCITQKSKFDFSQRDMVKIRRWAFNILQSEYNTSAFTDPYIKWLSKKMGSNCVGSLTFNLPSRVTNLENTEKENKESFLELCYEVS